MRGSLFFQLQFAIATWQLSLCFGRNALRPYNSLLDIGMAYVTRPSAFSSPFSEAIAPPCRCSGNCFEVAGMLPRDYLG